MATNFQSVVQGCAPPTTRRLACDRQDVSVAMVKNIRKTDEYRCDRYVIESVIGNPNFEGLVLGCIEADFRNQILVGKLLTRSIPPDQSSFAPLHSQSFCKFSSNFFLYKNIFGRPLQSSARVFKKKKNM